MRLGWRTRYNGTRRFHRQWHCDHADDQTIAWTLAQLYIQQIHGLFVSSFYTQTCTLSTIVPWFCILIPELRIPPTTEQTVGNDQRKSHYVGLLKLGTTQIGCRKRKVWIEKKTETGFQSLRLPMKSSTDSKNKRPQLNMIRSCSGYTSQNKSRTNKTNEVWATMYKQL